ncbi:Ig-like domain-containing protein, partial [uncultured Cytophaga sp.]|uniref:Ig-like domain-containing protein n=1 Tax=uncultured Cytophaga sp. TaxID=160238 RepID=UPI00262D4913
GLLWYTASTGGTGSSIAPIPATSAIGTTNYFVSQSTNGCESNRAQIAVTVNAAPATPTVTAAVSYCQNATSSALTASGTGLLWYTASTGGTGSSSIPIPATSAIGTTNYFVSQSIASCESNRAQITVTVNAAPLAEISVVGSTTILPGSTVTLNANTGTGLSYIWFNGNTQVGTESSYVAGTVGNYTVQVKNVSQCVATSVITSLSTRQDQPSVIKITSFEDNATVTSPVTITADVTDVDGAIVLVEYLDGDVVIGSSTSAPYAFTWINPSDGPHSIKVKATDALGGVTTSSPIHITTNTATTTATRSSMNNVFAIIYPIPAMSELIVESGIDLTGAFFKITNTLGEEISIPIQIESMNARLDVSGLSDGAYVLFINQYSSIITKKIIVAH